MFLIILGTSRGLNNCIATLKIHFRCEDLKKVQHNNANLKEYFKWFPQQIGIRYLLITLEILHYSW